MIPATHANGIATTCPMIRADVHAFQFRPSACSKNSNSSIRAPRHAKPTNSRQELDKAIIRLLLDLPVSMRTSAAGFLLSGKGENENCAVAPLPRICAKFTCFTSAAASWSISAGRLLRSWMDEPRITSPLPGGSTGQRRDQGLAAMMRNITYFFELKRK